MEPMEPQSIETHLVQNLTNNINTHQIQHQFEQINVGNIVQLNSQIQSTSVQLSTKNEKNAYRNEYLRSIGEIERIMENPIFKQIKFLKFILTDFSPFVFKQKLSPKYYQTQNHQQIIIQSQQHQQHQSEQHQHHQSEQHQHHSKQDQNQLNQNKKFLTITDQFFNSSTIDELLHYQQLSSMIKSNLILHSRIAFLLYLFTSPKTTHIQTYHFNLSPALLNLKQKLTTNNIRYSFDQFLWTTQQNQSQTETKNQPKQTNQSQNQYLISLINDQTLIKINHFCQILGFNDQNHLFNKKMKILTQTPYRLKYIKQFAFYSFKNKQQVFEFLSNNKSDRFNNIQFYQNQITATYNKLTLNQIHQLKAKDYSWLQRSHDYIQWLFPNHFQSHFNQSSFALGYVEAEIFKTDPQIQQRLIQSFKIYLDFMGCQIQPIQISTTHKSQVLIVVVENKQQIERLKDCLIWNTHNHLRIMRILACLSVTGFRNQANSFLTFLNGLKNSKFIDFSRIKHPLVTKWNLYQSPTQQTKFKALQMCFIPYEDFPQLQ